MDIIKSLKELILSRGKKPYLIAVGKPSPAKLGNFLEIDVFCLIACPENSLLDSRDFLRPVVTPYELLLALNPTSNWNPAFYELNLTSLAPKVKEQALFEYDEDEDEPHFSLVTGAYSVNKHFVHNNAKTETKDGAMVKKYDGTVSQTVVSAGAQFLNARSFKGLEEDLGSEIAKLEIGRSGIARNYQPTLD